MPEKVLSPAITLSEPFEVWTNGVYSFSVSTSPSCDYAVEIFLGTLRTGLYSFETLSDCYDWLEERGATLAEASHGPKRDNPLITVEEVNGLLAKYDWHPHFGVREFHEELCTLLSKKQGYSA